MDGHGMHNRSKAPTKKSIERVHPEAILKW